MKPDTDAPTVLEDDLGGVARHEARSASAALESPDGVLENDPDFKAVLDELTHAILWLRVAAILILLIAFAATTIAALKLPELTSNAADKIKDSGNATNMMIFELLRGAAFAAAVTSILFGLFSLGRACLDQATRFQKRLIAAHFLNFVLHTYRVQISDGSMKLPDVVSFLAAWSTNVDSAFTHVKFGSKGNQNMRLSAGKDGFAAATGDEAAGAPSDGLKKGA